MKCSEVMKSYIAGIIDGEGCIGIECMAPLQKKDGTWIRKHNYYTPRLTIVNTSYKLMELLVKEIGGKYDTRKKIEGRKTCYRWYIFGKDLENTIQEIIPYLFIKKEQAEIVLKFRQTVGKTGWHVSDEIMTMRHDLYLQCTNLNKVGS